MQDDADQSVVATRIFESDLSVSNKGHVCLVVLCEVVIERRDAVWKALRDFETGVADFSDYLIAHVNQACGSSATLPSPPERETLSSKQARSTESERAASPRGEHHSASRTYQADP